MKVRADIAALIHDGHSDTSIALQLGCHRATVNRARHALELPKNRLERLYAEAIPTGQVREYQPKRMPTAPAQAKANQPHSSPRSANAPQRPPDRGDVPNVIPGQVALPLSPMQPSLWSL